VNIIEGIVIRSPHSVHYDTIVIQEIPSVNSKGKGKVKVHPTTGHLGPEGGDRGIALLFL